MLYYENVLFGFTMLLACHKGTASWGTLYQHACMNSTTTGETYGVFQRCSKEDAGTSLKCTTLRCIIDNRQKMNDTGKLDIIWQRSGLSFFVSHLFYVRGIHMLLDIMCHNSLLNAR